MAIVLDHIRKSPHRNQLERYLHVYLPILVGDVLDVGSKNRRYDALLKNVPVAVDLVENKTKDIIAGDINSLPFPTGSFDAVICLEVLEYVDTPERAIKELARVTKHGGTVLVSVPFMYRVHDDMLRYTESYLKHHFSKEFATIECLPVGNAYTVILDIIKGKINEIPLRAVRYCCLGAYLPFALLAELLPVSKGRNYVSGYFVLAKK